MAQRPAHLLPVSLMLSALLAMAAASSGCGETAPGEAAPPTNTPDGAPGVERFEGEAGPLVEIPDEFPDDLPLYPEARPTAQVASPQHGRMLMFASDDPPEAVLEYFRRAWESAGWMVTHESDLDTERLVAFAKADRRASVAVGRTSSGSRITVAASGPSSGR